MTPEEFEQLKAKEREHLEKMRELKEAVRRLEHQRSVVNTLDKMRGGAHDLLDRQAEMVEGLARETAFLQAKAELGLEEEHSLRSQEMDEDTMRKIRAQQLLEQIKSEESGGERSPEAAPETPETPPDSQPNLPDKTIGRMR